MRVGGGIHCGSSLAITLHSFWNTDLHTTAEARDFAFKCLLGCGRASAAGGRRCCGIVRLALRRSIQPHRKTFSGVHNVASTRSFLSSVCFAKLARR